MERLNKVQCIECEKKYYIDDMLVPGDIRDEEAFPNNCPFCEDGRYAVLAGELKK